MGYAATPFSVEAIRASFDYDAETGILTRIRSVQPSAVGKAAGTLTGEGYLGLRWGMKGYLVHRLVWLWVHGKWPDHDIDHINGVRTDNRLANLRDVPRLINVQNQRRAQVINKSGFLGVSVCGKKFRATLIVTGPRRQLWLGTFATAEEAHAAYLAAKRIHHEGCTI